MTIVVWNISDMDKIYEIRGNTRSFNFSYLKHFWADEPSRIFYLTGYMTNPYPFIQGSLERPFSELFSSDVSLWKQCKYIAFNIFSFTILIVSCKMLMITGISNENTNELNIYAILCRKVTIFYRQKLASLFQVQKKLKACRNSKWHFSSCCFIADDSHVKIVWLHVVVFSKPDILHFRDNFHL